MEIYNLLPLYVFSSIFIPKYFELHTSFYKDMDGLVGRLNWQFCNFQVIVTLGFCIVQLNSFSMSQLLNSL